MGISQLIAGFLSICKMANKNNKSKMAGFPPFPFERVVISLVPRKSTAITKTENINQVIQIKSLRKTADKSYFGTCVSSIEGKNLITADAVIYLL